MRLTSVFNRRAERGLGRVSVLSKASASVGRDARRNASKADETTRKRMPGQEKEWKKAWRESGGQRVRETAPGGREARAHHRCDERTRSGTRQKVRRRRRLRVPVLEEREASHASGARNLE
eukprot:scaffold2858_cov659-Pavlova_lutheri.AAC.197